MGYYVRALSSKKCEPKWKVQYVSFKKSDYKNSQAKFPKKEWDISFARKQEGPFFPWQHLKGKC